MDFAFDTNFLIGLWRQPRDGVEVLWPTDATVLIYARTYSALRISKLAVGPNDLWVGATALAHEVPLLTRNVKELSRIDGLQVVNYATR